MPKIIESTETRIHENADGAVTIDTTQTTQKIDPSGEPDYIKIYTKMWCEFNEVPRAQQSLFLELATHMSYANTTADEGGQLVATGGPQGKAICERLAIKDSMYQKGLRILCECGAIRHVARGWYQINPQYAARGEWKYNPARDRGGVEDLVAKFSFKDKKVETKIVWADDGTDEEFRNGVGMGDGAVIRRTKIEPDDNIPGQMKIINAEMDVTS